MLQIAEAMDYLLMSSEQLPLPSLQGFYSWAQFWMIHLQDNAIKKIPKISWKVYHVWMSMIGNLCRQPFWLMFFKLCKIWGKNYTSLLFHPKNQAIKVTSRCFFNTWIQGNQGQTIYHVCLYPGTQHVDNEGNSLTWTFAQQTLKIKHHLTTHINPTVVGLMLRIPFS